MLDLILQTVREQPRLTARQIADRMAEKGVSTEDRTVYDKLCRMAKTGKVCREKGTLRVVSRVVTSKRRKAKGQEAISSMRERNINVILWTISGTP